MRRDFFLACIACAAIACGTKSQGETEPPDAGASDLLQADEGGLGDALAPREECAEANKLVFVLSRQNTLYKFDPIKLEFTAIGLLKCNAVGAFPTSMAIDRLGFAWVVHSDGSLWRVDTKNATCVATDYVPDQGDFHKFGMGFSTNGVSATSETLFVSDSDGKGLATIDTKTFKLTKIGPFDGPLTGRGSELTGTGDGRLFGFFTTSPAQVAEISKPDAHVASPASMASVNTGTDWAFSFYAGDFYLYTANDPAGLPMNQVGSDVTRYRPSDGSITVVKSKIGFNIVGAGVSTCAPIATPK